MNKSNSEARRIAVSWILRIVALVLLLGAGLCLVSVWIHIKKTNSGKFVRLNDGTTMELLGAANSTQKFATRQSHWERFAERALPTNMQGWMTPKYTEMATWPMTNALFIYFRVKSAPGFGSAFDSFLQYSANFEDEHGLKYQNNQFAAGSSSIGPSDEIYTIIVTKYPQQEKELALHLVNEKGSNVATFKIQNPGNF